MRNTLKITKNIMNKYNIKANKRFGQNFLIDDSVLEGIVENANISKNDLVIEIGPGLGNLTEYILERAGFTVLVEIDKNMIEILNDRFQNSDKFVLLNEDILKVSLDKYILKLKEERNINFEKVKVVANLPYYITTPILFKLLQEEESIDEIMVMVQKEVADRMVANPETKDYGILTLMIDYLSDADIKIIVPNDSFIPAPNVTSAVISLKKSRKYTVKNEKILFDLIHASFAKRRKKMINSLEMSNFNGLNKKQIEEIFKICDIDFNTRAEELKIEKYIQIADEVASR